MSTTAPASSAQPQEGIESISGAPKFLTSGRTEALDARFKPNQIAMGKYFIPGALGHSESEEIAARILMFCREEGKFVAPSYRAIANVIIAEMGKDAAVAQARNARHEAVRLAEQRPSASQQIAKKLPGLAKMLGISAHMPVTIPELTAEQKNYQSPMSPIIFSAMYKGINVLPYELKAMIDQGYLTETVVGEEAYYEPTVALIERLIRVQEGKRN